jgi:hypothetical protein
MVNSEPSPSVLILYPDLDHIAFYRCTYLPLETKEPTVKTLIFSVKRASRADILLPNTEYTFPRLTQVSAEFITKFVTPSSNHPSLNSFT